MSPLHCPWHTANKMMLLSLLLYIYLSIFLPMLNVLFLRPVDFLDLMEYSAIHQASGASCKAHPASADLACKTYSHRGWGLGNCLFPQLSPPENTPPQCQKRHCLGSSREPTPRRSLRDKESPSAAFMESQQEEVTLAPSRIPHTCQPRHKYSFTLFQGGLAWPVIHKHLRNTKLNSQMDLPLPFHHARPFAFTFSSLLTGTAEIFTTALALQQTSPIWNSSKPAVR